MNSFVIVGGGISGLVAARTLKRKEILFVGLEKENSLGGRASIGHHRLYEEVSAEFLSECAGEQGTECINEPPKQRKKGEFTDVDAEWADEERFYLGSPYFEPRVPIGQVVGRLISEVGESFELQKAVTKVDAETKTVTCEDGTSYPYEKLVWCSSLNLLNKVWSGDKAPLLKLMKKRRDLRGGINLELELNASLFPLRNTIVFPFRFKENKLRALGSETSFVEGETTRHFLNWLLFLDEEISEDREEVAKCLRALRRELEKEFPELKGLIKSERIIFLSGISGEEPLTGKSLSILPDVVYFGPELELEQESSKGLRNIDLTLAHRHLLESNL